MTTKIYLIRHAEAEGNWRRTFQGHSDGEISEKGHRQLELLSGRFCDVTLDAVYSSPLRRAMATAQAVNRAGLPIITDERLIEINGGGFEGLRFDELSEHFPTEHENWRLSPHLFTAPDGESMESVYARMREVMGEIAKNNAGKTVAVASHGCAIRNYQCFALGLALPHISEVTWCDNTAVTELEYDEDFSPRIILLGDSSHLPESESTLATQNWWRTVPERDESDVCDA